MDERKKLAATVALSGVGVALALVAAYGSPPYGFFAPFKWAEAAIALFLAWSLFKESGWSLIVSAPTLYVAFVLVTGKMHREQWKPWDEASAVLIGLCGVLAVGFGLRKPRTSADG